jgi:hypothetical protein
MITIRILSFQEKWRQNIGFNWKYNFRELSFIFEISIIKGKALFIFLEIA